MKLAVQIFGHLRTYEECYKNLRHYLLDRYDCDVFMHTWGTMDHDTKTWHNDFMANASESTSGLKEKLYEMYNLKDLIIEKQESKDLGFYVDESGERGVWGLHCMWRSKLEANRLREEYAAKHNITYNYVLVIRPDLLLCDNFIINNFLRKLTPEEFNTSLHTSFHPCNIRWNDLRYMGATDILYFAKPNIISNVYKNMDNLKEKIKEGMDLGDVLPEYYFLEHVQDLGYKVWLMDYFVSKHLIIKRASG